MDFVDDFTDLGAPEYCVSGIASIERINPGSRTSPGARMATRSPTMRCGIGRS
jgi:hypothetical protein